MARDAARIGELRGAEGLGIAASRARSGLARDARQLRHELAGIRDARRSD